MPSDYNQQSYPSRAQPQLHVDNLCVTARIHGFRAAAPERARVLEIGCGNAANLIAMAAGLPGAEFVGVDYASDPIASAKETVSELNLKNVRVHHADICELADDFGEFDYIIAHGFYSWAPDAARDAMWRVTRGSLAPDGILFVSYNVLPGWRQTAMLRDLLLLEGRRYGTDSEGPAAVWRVVELLASLERTGHPLAGEAARSLSKGLEVAIHDEFQPETRPFLFREVRQAAEAAGLRYAGDAVPKVRGGLQQVPETAEWLAAATQGDPLLEEEYYDVLTLRRFRQSVFVQAAQEPDGRSLLERLAGLWMRGKLRMGEPGADGARVYHAPDSDLRFSTNDALLAALCTEFSREPQSRLPVSETLHALMAASPDLSETLRQEFLRLFVELVPMGAFQFHSMPFQPPPATAIVPTARLQVSALTRWEAAGNQPVTTPDHDAMPLQDPLHRAMLVLLDGSRTVEMVSAAIADAVWSQQQAGAPDVELGGARLHLLGSSAFRNHPDALASREALDGFTSLVVASELERMRGWGLLWLGDGA